jgi:glycosyltransferase involved in cell wall biosynthesis
MPAEVTAVITTHDRPDTVQEALASVRAETYPDIECVIVDDGGTFELPAAGSGIEVRVVRGGELGVAAARNLGLAAARGKFVIFLDDDDVALPNRITTLVGAARPFDADLCFGLTRRAVAGSTLALPPVPTELLTSGDIGFCDVLTCTPHVNSVLVRTSALRDIGGFDAEAHHFDDWSAWLRLADRNVIMRCVDEVVAEWRIHGNGLSAGILHAGAMKSRLTALFDRLRTQLSEAGVRAIAAAQLVVASSEIVTYDDYVQAMAAARAALHATGACLGKRLRAHMEPPVASGINAFPVL